MIIELEEKTHCYSVNGDIASISLTELLSKHGLSPSYNGVSKGKLRESAMVGKSIHKDLEDIFNFVGYKPKTPQGENFLKYVKENIDCGIAEQKLAIEYKGLIIAGTADLLAILKDGTKVMADHKTTSKVYKEAVSWQTSILDYMARKIGLENVNGKPLNWKGANKFLCYHYKKDTGEMNVIELDKVDDEEIERLFECELNGEIYQRPNLIVGSDLQEKFVKAENELYHIEMAYKTAVENAKHYREAICELFEQQNIKSWESPNGKIKITHIDPYEKLTIDSKSLKEKYPQAYENCLKLTKVKSTVKVLLKEGK